ncbi:MAG: NUDIX hydrolase [Magnetococcales bacterium]|nr:NUDIX hydrolase [Magnetococcales bacterium]
MTRELTTPFLAADVIIELIDHPGRPIVLIDRRNPPYGLAIPGGFVDRGAESVEQAAVREAMEETSLPVRLIALLGIYSHPERDSRMHTATAIYVGEAHGSPMAADDARAVRVVALEEIAGLADSLAFDHRMVLEDYRVFRATGGVAPLRGIQA